MKSTLYSLLTLGSLLLLAPSSATANAASFREDNPTEVQRKTAARARVAEAKKADFAKKSSSRKLRKTNGGLSHAMLVLLGLEESKAVTSPAKRERQLHAHQKQLQVKARQQSKAHRARVIKQMK
jgi:hypothetical protein